MTLHRIRTHPVYVGGCFGCKAATVNIQTMQIRGVAQASARKQLGD